MAPSKRPSSAPDLSIAIPDKPSPSTLTARIAGSIRDLRLDVSPKSAGEPAALRNMAKALNLALQGDFLETRLEPVYEVARVRKGTVKLLHREYIGLGDGIMASVGKAAKSFTLTLRGPDPVSPANVDDQGFRPIRGTLSLLARKLDLVQEFEDMVPGYVEQALDRLESVAVVVNWHRDEWHIETTLVGLDAVLTPVHEDEASRTKRIEDAPRRRGKRG